MASATSPTAPAMSISRAASSICPTSMRASASRSWNMFCVLLPLDRMAISRRQFRDALDSRGIATGMSYEALHLCTLGRSLGGRDGQFPNAERIARATVTLPLHVGMTEADVDRVCAAVAEVMAGARK